MNKLCKEIWYIMLLLQYALIVPQVGFNHLIEPVPHESYFDTRSVDFVLYDKENFYPVLAIEVNGFAHHIGHTHEKDIVKEQTLNKAGLTLLIFDAKSKYTYEDKKQIDAALVFSGRV